jgi:hypothetical protein
MQGYGAGGGKQPRVVPPLGNPVLPLATPSGTNSTGVAAAAAVSLPASSSSAFVSSSSSSGIGVDVSPMLMDDGREDRADVHTRKLAMARANAQKYIAEQLASLKASGLRYAEMHSSSQVLLLTHDEVLDTMALNWCKPGEENLIKDIVNTWDMPDLAACVHHVGLPVLYARANYLKNMRRSVVDAVKAHAKAHPELFEEDVPLASGDEPDGEDPPVPSSSSSSFSAAAAASKPRVSSSPRASRASPVSAAVVPAKERRSPRALASSRSAAATALAALNKSFPSSGVVPSVSSSRRSAAAGAAVPPSSDLRLSGAGSDEDEDDSDDDDFVDDGAGDSQDPFSFGSGGSVRRGGRLRKEELAHQLAAAGVERSIKFHEAFVRNAQTAAGGRSMFQLYTDVTSTFPHEARHGKRECLALSRILDALLRKDYDAALEHTCRRLGGVHTAVDTGNWAMCERLEMESEQRSFVPDEFMRSALRSVTQMQAVRKSAANGAAGKTTKAAGGSSSYNGGGKGRGRSKSNKKDGPNNQEQSGSGASTSNKKKGGSGKE